MVDTIITITIAIVTKYKSNINTERAYSISGVGCYLRGSVITAKGAGRQEDDAR